MNVYFLFFSAALILIGLIGIVWHFWRSFVRRSPEEREHERALASLNDAQAHRVSDQQLTRPPDTDSAWNTMVQRGGAPSSSRKRRRPPGRRR